MIQQIYEAGYQSYFYTGTQILSVLLAFGYTLFHCKKYKMKVLDAILALLIGIGFVYLWSMVEPWIESGFSTWGTKNTVRGIIVLPLVAWPTAKLLNVKYNKIMDLAGPVLCLVQGVGHIGCIFVGCCHGYASDWGIYNPVYDEIQFPIQLVEAAVAVAVFVILVIIAVKMKYKTYGLLGPLSLVLFGLTRFACEFGRDNFKLFGNVSVLALHCLSFVLVGLVWLIVYAILYKKKYFQNKELAEAAATK